MWFTLVLVSVAGFGVFFSDAQEGVRCQTPLRDPGICVNIKQCDGLITLLKTQSNNPEVRNYLLRSACGYFGVEPLVCCPQIGGEQPEPPPTTTTTTTTPLPPPVTPPPQPELASERSNTNSLLTPPYCGYSNSSANRIVGGLPAKLGQFPWVVELGYRNSNNPDQPKWLCGGSLITEVHILTAGHCVYNRPDLYLARLGDLDLYSDDDGANPVDIPLINAKVHEDYSPTSYTNDIAILTLAYKPDNPTIWPICLPTNEPLRSNLFVKYLPFVAGWGSIYFNGPSSSILQVVQLPVVSNDNCKQAFESFKAQVIDDRVLCAGYIQGGKDACKGDSGGPLMLGRQADGQTTFYQIGVVSYGFKCAEPGYPGVYSRVTYFLDWITQNLNEPFL